MQKYYSLFSSFTAIFVGQNSPKINFDYGQFKVDSTHNLLEIYFQYKSETLLQSIKNYDQQENLKILFALKDSLQQSTNYSDTVLIPVSKSNSVANSPSSPSLALHKFILPEGVYFLNIFLIDFDDSKIDITRNEKIVITSFAKSKSVLSDIQLAYQIDPAEENSIFTKNTLKIIPNPNASYSSEVPLLNYYTELYNVNRTSLLLSTFIVSQKLDVVYSKKKEIETDREESRRGW
ncbi:MAG: hypothetical protein U5K00_12755 [Melioribacteraceae bacterium]|nr:hypothetical protein [Melioribacteraceae bacterium]